jgi:hypothetical protein
LFALPPAEIAGQTGILVRSERRSDPPSPADWSEVAPIGEAVRSQNGGMAESYRLFRVTARAGGAAAAVMPKP